MKSTIETAMAKDKNETRTTATNNPRKECNESGNVKKNTKSQSRLTKAINAAVPSVGKMHLSGNKHCTDSNSTTEMKQSLSDIIEISLDTFVELAKTYDSQETLLYAPELQQKVKSANSEFLKGKGKWKPIKAL